tara:strand:- start:857 stop:1096 length:240 start_codon:yes stop_codon:yes gene_type:complete
MSEWFSWSNMFYLIGIVLAGSLTMVASRYTSIVKEMKEVAKVLEEAYEDGHLSKKEKESVMKECLDVVKSIINLKWKIF